MCGIAALIRPYGHQGGEVLSKMIDVVYHRGPNGQCKQTFQQEKDSNTWRLGLDGEIGFAHARLSIVDLSLNSQQPMPDASGRWWLTYNGEIYNYIELRNELMLLGYSFRSYSDTEVLLYAWIAWGEICLNKFNGIFSFVLFDRQEGELWAVRDRFGVKPLYWWRSPDGTFAIASEIKQFSVLPGWEAKLNPQRVYDFLAWNVIDHTDETLFDGVRQLRGGEIFNTSIDGLQKGRQPEVRTWYDLKPNPNVQGLGRTEAASQFIDLLKDSIRLHLRADVDVGSCLSGGLDSSSLVCITHQLLNTDVRSDKFQHTFSARSDIAVYDEGYYINEVVRSTCVKQHEVTPSFDDLFRLLPEMVWHQDEPFGSTSAYAQWHVFALAKDAGVQVLLDGQGADEILGGYHSFFGPRLADLFLDGRISRLINEILALQKIHGMSPTHSLARMLDALLPNEFRQRARALMGRPSVHLSWLDHERLGAEPLDPFASLGARQPTIRSLSMAQVIYTNLPMLLHCEDRNSMAHSVEGRVPYLDHRLVEFAMGLKDECKVSDGITKRVLRDSMRNILPESVRSRQDKLGFVTPEEIWVRRTPLPFRKALVEAIERANGFLNSDLLDSFDAMLANKQPYSGQWWRAISFGAWMARFDVQT